MKVSRYVGNLSLSLHFDRHLRGYVIEATSTEKQAIRLSALEEEVFVRRELVPSHLEDYCALAFDCAAQVVLNSVGIRNTLERKHYSCSCTNGYVTRMVDRIPLEALRYDKSELHEVRSCGTCDAYVDHVQAHAQWVADGKPRC